MSNKNRGITIITLVITIIILLILAGISIASLIGNDGLINKAKKAAKDYENAQEDELAQLNIIEHSIKSDDIEMDTGDISDAKYKVLLQEINNLKNKVEEQTIDKIYPVGSIYISTDLSTAEDVATKFGGTWESYGQGRTLIGVGTGNDGSNNKEFLVNSTGGEYNHTLSVAEMPTHSHSYSGRTGIAKAATNLNIILGGENYTDTIWGGQWVFGFIQNLSKIDAYSKDSSNWTGANHYHEYSGNTQNAGENNSHNNIQPYIAVYMWKRIS